MSKWSGLDQLAKRYKDKPVLFVAVNSGNSKSTVESYAKTVKTSWPMIVDSSRAFEKQFGFTISLNNIYQAAILTPGGKVVTVFPDDLSRDIDAMLPKASWTIDPAEIADPLKPAWRSIEFGDFVSGLPEVKKGLSSSNDATKKAAGLLNDVIGKEAASRFASSVGVEALGDKWVAYKSYAGVVRDFPGSPEGKKSGDSMRTLGSDKKVKDELKAAAYFENARKLLGDPNRKRQDEGLALLAALVKQYPDTEAGAMAQGILDGQ